MKTPFTDHYDQTFLLETMMGPNAMRTMEELTASLPLKAGMRVLDLGCGMGISSILLAEKFGVTVFAPDLWIDPADNAARFARLGLDGKIIPLSVDMTKDVPFAREYFDAIVSVDAYQYFGDNDAMLPKLLPLLKPGGLMAVSVPGFTGDYSADNVPPELKSIWIPEWHFYSLGWWQALWTKEPGLNLTECREMDCFKQSWEDWLQSTAYPEPVKSDIAMMEAGGWKYFNLIQLTGRKA
ncbi:MAG: methyltransferase domain-containing protein [Candidatus Adiutrix sp.]|jgi:cyclopropane fatty-acyl-phospholipid synthase-like methyltransferase|nr:methyltransferase domain-containing protein [Candidatus Adiutrix sp.]